MQKVGWKMQEVPRQVFGCRPVPGPSEGDDERGAEGEPDPADDLLPAPDSNEQTRSEHDDERATHQPDFTELRLRQHDADNALLHDRSERHSAYLGPHDNEPADTGKKRQQQARPGEREEPPIEPSFERGRPFCLAKCWCCDQAPQCESPLEQSGRRIMERSRDNQQWVDDTFTFRER